MAKEKAFKLLLKRLIYGRKYSKSGDWFFQDHVLEKQAYREWAANPPQGGSALSISRPTCKTCAAHTIGCNDEGIICSFHKNRSKYPYDKGWDNPAPVEEFRR